MIQDDPGTGPLQLGGESHGIIQRQQGTHRRHRVQARGPQDMQGLNARTGGIGVIRKRRRQFGGIGLHRHVNANVAPLPKALQQSHILNHQGRVGLNDQQIRSATHHGVQQLPRGPPGPFLRRIRLGHAGQKNLEGLGLAGPGMLQSIILRTIGIHRACLDVQEPSPRPSPDVIRIPLRVAVHAAERLAQRTSPVQIYRMGKPRSQISPRRIQNGFAGNFSDFHGKLDHPSERALVREYGVENSKDRDLS